MKYFKNRASIGWLYTAVVFWVAVIVLVILAFATGNGRVFMSVIIFSGQAFMWSVLAFVFRKKDEKQMRKSGVGAMDGYYDERAEKIQGKAAHVTFFIQLGMIIIMTIVSQALFIYNIIESPLLFIFMSVLLVINLLSYVIAYGHYAKVY